MMDILVRDELTTESRALDDITMVVAKYLVKRHGAAENIHIGS